MPFDCHLLLFGLACTYFEGKGTDKLCHIYTQLKSLLLQQTLYLHKDRFPASSLRRVTDISQLIEEFLLI